MHHASHVLLLAHNIVWNAKTTNFWPKQLTVPSSGHVCPLVFRGVENTVSLTIPAILYVAPATLPASSASAQELIDVQPATKLAQKNTYSH